MHELSIARSIVGIVREHLPAGGGATVRSVRLRVGRLSGVAPASLGFCFDAAAEGSELSGASLVIDEVPVAARCDECGTTSEMAFPFGECPACRSARLTVASGTELEVVEIELEEEGGAR